MQCQDACRQNGNGREIAMVARQGVALQAIACSDVMDDATELDSVRPSHFRILAESHTGIEVRNWLLAP
jgi:hypothetical protein